MDSQGNWNIEWLSNEDKCVTNGICAVNSFCSMADGVTWCKCLPGFSLVILGNWSLGCERYFSMESRKDKDQYVNYRIRSQDNIEGLDT